MTYKDFLTSIEQWLNDHLLEFIISLLIIVLFFISRRIVKKLVIRHAAKHDFDKSRMLYVVKITGMVNFMIFAVLLGFVWEISLSGLSFYFASIFTVIGVALFANWSILSNMTASVILFFFFPHKIGSHIKIQDGEDSIEGVILDIKVFYILIETAEGKTISYPNNLAMQKPIINIKN